MTRILFFNYEFPPLGGGAANATRYLMQEYAQRDDVKIDLITAAVGNKYEKKKYGKNIIIHRIPIDKNIHSLHYQTKKELVLYTWKAYFFARKLIKQNTYDMTHSFFGVPCGVISYLLKKQYKIPYIVSLRGADVPYYSERFECIYFFLTPIIHAVWKCAHDVVANSAELKRLAHASKKQQKIKIIYNGVDTCFYKQKEFTKKKKDQAFYILLASRLSKRKGFIYAINAFAQLYKTYPQIRMIIAGGEGNAMDELQMQVKKKKLEKVVRFTGQYTKEHSIKIYQDADVFVMPSLNEGMSNNLLEALASGLPVLMTPTGGAKELIHNEKNGFLIKMRDTKSIVKYLKKFIESPELCNQFGKESRLVAEKMSWKHVAEEYVALYNKINEKKY